MRSKVDTLPGFPAVPAARSSGNTALDHRATAGKRMYRLKYRGRIIDSGTDYARLKGKGDQLYALGGRRLSIVTAEGYELCTWGLG
jgi:hypothetical protein